MTACVVGSLSTGAVACQPTLEKGLTPVGVALAADQVGTRALEGHGVTVRWLTCRASLRTTSQHASGSHRATSDNGVALVVCKGRSAEGDRLRLSGQVTQQHPSLCLRGRLQAEVGDRPLFTARRLGECGGPADTDAPARRPTPSPSGVRPTVTETVTPGEAVPTSPVTVTVTASRQPRPTVTETVTPTGPSSGSPDEPSPSESEHAAPVPSASPSPAPSDRDDEAAPRPSGSPAATPD